MIQRLTKDNIEPVVNLHIKVLGHTLNSSIGRWFLKRLYAITDDSVDNGSCYVFSEDNKTLGFISFCFDHAKLEEEIMSRFSLAEKAKIAGAFLTRPRLLPVFVRQQYFGKYLKNNFSQPYASILTLGVSPDTQGQGIGGQLIEKTKEIMRDRNIKDLFVDTEEDNVKAAAFYRKNGFQQMAIISGNIVLKCSI